VGIGLNRSFQDTMANAVTSSENFARLLEGHTVGTVRAIDQSLIGVQRALAPRTDAPPPGDGEINATLRSLLAAGTEFRNLSISDATGRLTHSAVPSGQVINVSDRSFFLAHAQGHQGLYISEPFNSRAGWGLTIALSRRLANADGNFAGIVVAAVDLQHFQSFYASMDLARGGTLSLWNNDGVILARYPQIEDLIGRPPPPAFTYRGLRASDPPSGTFRMKTVTDQIDRMVSYRRLDNYPLTVMAAFSYDEVLSKWQRQALYFGGAALALAATIMLLTWAVVRELTRRELAENRFISLVANVPGVVYRRRQAPNGDVSYPWISQGVDELLGWTREEVIRDSTPLVDCIHEDDQAACKAAHVASAADLSPLNWEGRVWTRDGRLIWIQSISRPNRTKDGAIEWDGVLLDITERKTIAEQRDESRRLLDEVIDAVPAVIGVKDLDLRYVLINKGLAEELNVAAPAAAIGKRRDDFPLPGVSAAENARFFADVSARERKVLAGGLADLFHEERVERQDGTLQTKLNSKIPLFDEGGRVRALLTVTIDISDRKSAEHALDESRRLLQAVVDAVPATVSVKDLEGHYLLINRALAQQFNCRPEDAVGRTLADFTLRGAVPEESAKMAERVAVVERQLLAEGRPRLSHEETVRQEDGSYWTGLSSKVPLRDSEGRIYALLSVVIDISDRKRAEQAVQQSRQLLQDVIDAVPAAIAVKDRDLRFILVNHGFEELYQTPARDILGRRTGEFRGSENAALVEAMDREVLRTGKALPFREIESQSEEDRGRTYWMGKMPLRNGDGQVFGTVGVALDISERKATEDKLRQSQKLEAIGQLTGGLAHDFNNLLSIILGNLELLSERLQGQDTLRQLTQVATRATLRGADLTQRLLAYARRQPLQPRRTDINQLVGDVAEILTRTLGETIQLETRLGSNLWATQIDPGQLENALINLAVNARDAMPRGGALTIETMNTDIDAGSGGLGDDVAPGAYVLIAVSDTGVGMAPAVIERAFEPFFTTKETGKGSGLGLSMVYGFVRQSGGYVKIYSEVGRGTTIKLYLPRAPGDDQAVQAPRAQDGVPNGQGERILIVEDNPAVQALVVHMVQTLGYQAVAASDGPSALGLLDGCPFDLLLTDVILPRGLGGPALAREARTHCPDLKVIYMSGYTESALLRDNAVEPYAILISKPFRKAELARRLREALSAKT
jgi:PAS domain S-box-containing protein